MFTLGFENLANIYTRPQTPNKALRSQHGVHMIMSGFKNKINVNYTEIFGSYRAVNIIRLCYTNQ
jgi:hypothetical protein